MSELPLPDKKYNIIYADPPWNFKSYSQTNTMKNVNEHYKTVNIKDIKELPVNDIADNDCVLLMWVTYPNLVEGIETIKSWGFTYKTCGFSWIKKNKKADSFFWGLGYWTRSNNEICLLATKGKPKRVSKSVHQVVYERIREHSRKPDCIKNKIVDLCGDLPRIELFARQQTEGWDSWGNEV